MHALRRPLTRFLFATCLPCAALAADIVWPDPVGSPSESMPRASRAVVLDAVRTDAGRLVVVGERGHVLLSDDRGETWRQAGAPTRSTLAAVAALDSTVIAVGHDGVILRSTDTGETWQRVRDEAFSLDNLASPSNGSPLLDVIFLDASRVLAVGAYSLVLASSDAGATWAPAPMALVESGSVPADVVADDAAAAVDAPASGEADLAQDAVDDAGDAVLFSEDELLLDDEVDPHLNAIERLDNGVLLVVGERGTLYRSRDDGATWQRITLPYGGSMFGALPLGSARVIVFGLRGRAFESDDAGDTWRDVDTGVQATLFGAGAAMDGSIAIVGAEGAILRRAAGEDQFQTSVYSTDSGETPTNSDVLVRDDGSLLLMGERGVAAWRQP